jgi:hypothetical protein
MNGLESRDGLRAEEVRLLEEELQSRGFCPTAKTNEKELAPGEYVKHSHYANPHDFTGPVVWRVVWKLR